jgi:hypothetical protein
MASKDHTLLVNHDRNDKSELEHAGGDLLNLSLAVRARVARSLCVRALRWLTLRSAIERGSIIGANGWTNALASASRGAASPTTGWWASL